MAVSGSFREFVAEQLAVVGPVTIRAMFGGAGVYLGGRMFALIAFETLYLKADEGSKADFEAEGMGPFAYDAGGGKNIIMSYWQCPERLYDDVDEMRLWALRAIAVATKAAAKKKPPARHGTSTAATRRKPGKRPSR